MLAAAARLAATVLTICTLCHVLSVSASHRTAHRQRRHPAADVSVNEDFQKGFEAIYSEKSWGEDGGGSGAGSSPVATSNTRGILRTVVNKYELHSLVDAPCGAMAWMPLALRDIKEDLPGFR